MDDLWYSEYHTANVRYSIKVQKQLHSEESEYQHIAVYESPEFGRFLTLDSVMMMTERDEFIYHEMIVHTAFGVKPEIEKVLVIGAGDGGVARELSKYPNLKFVDIIEIDQRVIDICKTYLPQTACGFNDPRISVQIDDGLRFVRQVPPNSYDLIIVDSTDPSGPGEVLFTKEFYGSCHKALTETGIMINQHESPFFEEDAKAMQFAHKRIVQSFPLSRVFQAHIPTYPSGHWLFGFSSKGLHPVKDMKADHWKTFGIKTKYYNTNLHLGSFALPTYVEEKLRYDET